MVFTLLWDSLSKAHYVLIKGLTLVPSGVLSGIIWTNQLIDLLPLPNDCYFAFVECIILYRFDEILLIK